MLSPLYTGLGSYTLGISYIGQQISCTPAFTSVPIFNLRVGLGAIVPGGTYRRFFKFRLLSWQVRIAEDSASSGGTGPMNGYSI